MSGKTRLAENNDAEAFRTARADSERAAAVPRVAGATIVIVDDDASILRSLDRILSAHGFRVRTFAIASEALASDLPRSNACMIVDVNMPQMNGFQFCESLRNSGRNLPTIMITGDTVRDAHNSASSDALLFKPIEKQKLLNTISRMLVRST
jgi:FixJ family two-component response regulator